MWAKFRQDFKVTVKTKVEVKRQRPNKVPLHLKDKLQKLLTQLKDAEKKLEMEKDDEMGLFFVNPIILKPNSDYVRLVIDAGHVNSVTDLNNFSWCLEPVQMMMIRVNPILFSVSDLSCANHQILLNLETQNLINFIIGGRQYTFTRGFYGLCGLLKSFSRLLTIHFEPLLTRRNKPSRTLMILYCSQRTKTRRSLFSTNITLSFDKLASRPLLTRRSFFG